jgi:hypothetical protein
MERRTVLALAALSLCGACATPLFEPPPHWWAEGGRLCAADREDLNWTRAAPRACRQAQADETFSAGASRRDG